MGWLKNKQREANSRLTEAQVQLATQIYLNEKLFDPAIDKMKASSERMKAERLAKRAAKKAEKLSKKGLTS